MLIILTFCILSLAPPFNLEVNVVAFAADDRH